MHRLLLLLLLLPLAGCASLVEWFEDPPALPTRWADAARATVSPATPMEEELSPLAEYGPADDRDTCDLEDLDEDDREALGEVVVRLGKGRYVLDDAVLLRADRLVLEGAGTHLTRLELDTDSSASLRVVGAEQVVLRGLTVASHTGGGLFVHDCPDVVVEDVHFVAAPYGLSLEGSVAQVSSSLFAGCKRGIAGRGSSVAVRETAFMDCWDALFGPVVDVEACVFTENRNVYRGALDARSRFLGSLFAGEKQDLGWTGRPQLAADNMARARDLGDRLGEHTNKELRALEDFPERVQRPQGMDLVAVHLALLRAQKRGERDPGAAIEAITAERAEAYARAAQRALEKRDVPAAKEAARIALRYWGERPLDGAPLALVEVAALADP